MGLSNSTLRESDSTLHEYQLSAGGIDKGIPTIICVSREKVWRRFVRFNGMSFFLSTPNGEPIYIVDFVNDLYGNIILHNGPSIDSPALAASGRPSSWHNDYLIRLPPVSGNAPQEEMLYDDSGFRLCFWFDIQVGHGPDQRVERFEWRRSRGAEVKSVGLSRRGGYKLVRLDSTNTKEEDIHDGSTNGEGYSSDGKEVVAVWASTSSFQSGPGVGEFHFRGSGATGELGQLWALMALMSCISIWQMAERAAAQAATHGAAGSAAAGSAAASSAAAAASAGAIAGAR